MPWLLVLVALSGCRQLLGLDEPQGTGDAGITVDASDGGLSDAFVAPDGCVSLTTQFDTCAATFGGDLVLVGSNTYNTDTHVLTTPLGPINVTTKIVNGPASEMDVLLVGAFELQSSSGLRVTGSRPFAIIATKGVVVSGTIDVGAVGNTGGAGARVTCALGQGQMGANGNNANPSGGGGGAAFASAGGGGSNGGGNGGNGGVGGTAQAKPVGPVGGCKGGRGGSANANVAEPGAGGGAILIASPSIMIPTGGVIEAGGGGGRGGGTGGGAVDMQGGAGGGSGGMIILESPAITISGTLAANGGGGGEGAGSSSMGNGGGDALPSATRAAGGGGGSLGGANGGVGGSVIGPTGGNAAQAMNGGGGGGGGGGVGYIALSATPTLGGGAVISPASQAWP